MRWTTVKKILLIIVALVLLPGCGRTISEPKDARCVHNEPLILREKVYDLNENLVQIFEYEYDKRNRYSGMKQYISDDDGNMKIADVFEYKYLYNTYVVTRKDYLNDEEVTNNVYDYYGNELKSEYVDKEGEVQEVSYTYKYLEMDENREKYECYFEGEEKPIYTFTREFDEKGNETFSELSGDSGITRRLTKYSYSTDERIIKEEYFENEDTDKWIDKPSGIKENIYNDNGQIIKSSYRDEILPANKLTRLETDETYGYDYLGRVVRKETINKVTDNGGETRQSGNVIIYEYVNG